MKNTKGILRKAIAMLLMGVMVATAVPAGILDASAPADVYAVEKEDDLSLSQTADESTAQDELSEQTDEEASLSESETLSDEEQDSETEDTEESATEDETASEQSDTEAESAEETAKATDKTGIDEPATDEVAALGAGDNTAINLTKDSDNTYYTNLPTTGTNVLTLKNANISTFKVYDDGGKDGNYSTVCDGKLMIRVPDGYKMLLSGSVVTSAYDESNDYLNIYDGGSTDSAKLVDQLRTAKYYYYQAVRFDDVISSGSSIVIEFCSNCGSIHSPNRGLDMTVSLFKDVEHNINIKESEGGTITTDVSKAKYKSTVTVTISPREGYLPEELIVTDSDGNKIDVSGGHWYEGGTASFTMPISAVTVEERFTDKTSAEEGLTVYTPQNGEQINMVIPDSVTSYKVIEPVNENGKVTKLDGTLIMQAPQDLRLLLSGDVKDANNSMRTLLIYDGTDDSKKLAEVKEIGDEKEHTISEYTDDKLLSTGREMKLSFSATMDLEYGGQPWLDLTVDVISTTEQYDVSINTAEHGSLRSDKDKAYRGEKITLTASPEAGYLLNGVTVKDENGNEIKVNGGRWFEGNTVTFAMPKSKVTVTPVFVSTASELVFNIPATGGYTLNIPEGVTTFRIVSDTSVEGASAARLALAAPAGKRLVITGSCSVKNQYFNICNGSYISLTADKPIVGYTHFSADSDGWVKDIPVITSSEERIYCSFYRPKGGLDLLDLHVDVVDQSKDNPIEIIQSEGGTIICNDSKAKVGEEVSITVNSDTGYLIKDLKAVTASGKEVIVKGAKWYTGNTGTFIMPAEKVILTPTFTDDLSAEGGLYIDLIQDEEGIPTANIPEGVRSFKLYDAGGADGNFWYYPNKLQLEAPEGSALLLEGTLTILLKGGDNFSIYESDNSTHFKLKYESYKVGQAVSVGLVKSHGRNLVLQFDDYHHSDCWTEFDGYDFTVTVLPPASVVTVPEAKSGLTYNGSPRELISGGIAEGGTLFYAMTDTDSEPEDSAYSTAIPTATDAGTYYVWYKIRGDGSHGDSAAARLSVEIAKADYDGKKTVEYIAKSGAQPDSIRIRLPEPPAGAEINAVMPDDSGIPVNNDPSVIDNVLVIDTADKTWTYDFRGCFCVKYSNAANYKDYNIEVVISVLGSPDTLWIESIPDTDYTGAAIKPIPVVHFGDIILTPKDYTLSYKNNKAAADKNSDKAPAVIVKGRGNYAGTAIETFTINKLDISKAIAPDIVLAYNKKVQKGKTTVSYVLNGKKVTLKEKTDYELEYSEEPKEAKEYTVTVKGIGNYKESTEFKETIADSAHMISKIKLPAIPDQDYSGKAFVLEASQVTDPKIQTGFVDKKGEEYKFTLKSGSTGLNYGDDYELTYENNKEVGTATVTVTGKGEYVGTKTATFKINGVKLSSLKSDGFVKSFDYDPNITPFKQTGFRFYYMEGRGKNAVRHNLEENKDYYATYSDNTDAGTATVTYTGLGEYCGTVKKTYKIKGFPMSAVEIQGDFSNSSGRFNKAFAYVSFYDPQAKAFSYTGLPYEVAGPANAEGEAGNYNIELKREDSNLKNGKDYTITYRNNVLPGTAEIIFTGKGRYTGSVKRTFKIKPHNIKDRDCIVVLDLQYPYTKGGSTPRPEVKYKFEDSFTIFVDKTLKEGVDYTLKWSDNNAVTTADTRKKPTVTITGKGAFTDSVTKEFEIQQIPLEGHTTVEAKDIAYAEKPGICKTTVTLTDKTTGMKLTAGTDYEREFIYSYAEDTTVKKPIYTGKKITGYEEDVVRTAGTIVDQKEDIIPAGTKINVTVKGKGNYKDTAVGSFHVVDKGHDLSKAKITISPKAYTGSKITLSDDDISFTVNGQPVSLKQGVDYEIIEAPKAGYTEKGKYNVTVRGIGNGYGFSKKVSFSIIARTLDYTIRYNDNGETLLNGLAQALLDKDTAEHGTPENDLEYYKTYCSENYRINGTMKDFVTTSGGKLGKNTYTVQKKTVDSKGRDKWVNVPATEISFSGWNTAIDGSGTAFGNTAVFKPSWLTRMLFGEHYILYAQWEIK